MPKIAPMPLPKRKARRTPGVIRQALDRWRGKQINYNLAPYQARLTGVAALEAEYTALSDEELRAHFAKKKAMVAEGGSLDAALPEVFAMAREAARRTIGLRPYDVQVIGAIAMFEGNIVEMETGEGKTLTAVLTASLAALSGRGVHVLTFNDYLARRDAAWMGPVYEFLGLTVGAVQAAMLPAARREAYAADITYLTAKEAGFDYLRDGLAYDPINCVQRERYFAIVDEADSILIDEARIPLVIAGSSDAQSLDLTKFAALAARMSAGEHFSPDQEQRNVTLTEAGIHFVEEALGINDLHDPSGAQRPWLTAINQAVHAKALIHRDVDYIIREGAIVLVDELTGRVVPDRQWPDGLHAAIEAKEGLRLGDEGEILGSITLQHFFRLYTHLAGMTATARPEEDEIFDFYKVGVVVLPTHHPCIRVDRDAEIYTHIGAKREAIYQLIDEAHEKKRPVLLGTASVRESEEIAAALEARGHKVQVLNAKNDDQEAAIIAEAGAPGTITISTNMAGRGTDIRLGGKDEAHRDAVLAAGGLLVIGTNRHDSRRIDNQLRGRAGRQGDPGSSIYLISLEDETMVRNGIDALLSDKLREQQPGPIDHPMAKQRTAWAQRVIEGQLLDQRRNLWQYASFIEKQRSMLRSRRDHLLHEPDDPGLWRELRPERTQTLHKLLGETDAIALERLSTVACIDKCWAEHLKTMADIREHIHLVRLGNQSPLQEFIKLAGQAFGDTLDSIDATSVAALDDIDLQAAALQELREQIKGPASTWTYMVDDNPYREMLGLQAAANLALGIGAAIYAPLYILVGIYHRWFRKRKRESGEESERK